MLRGLVGLSLQFRFVLAFVAAALLGAGYVQLRNALVDLLPEFSPPQVEVQTEALGLAAAEVEALITVPLEEILAGVPWLQSVHSNSINGLSSILLTFEPGTDVMDGRQMVQERLLHSSALPKVSRRPAMLQPVSSTNRVMNIGLRSDTLSLIDLSVLARWNIKPKLMGVSGVANIAVWGQRERQLQVQVDPAKLKASGVVLSDVIKASGDALWYSPLTYLQASTPGNGGFIDTPTQRLDVRHVLPITAPEDLAQITFQSADGASHRLGDVANVIESHPPLIGDAVIKDAPGLLLVVEKFPWANTPDVTRGVEEALATLRPGLPGVEVDATIFRPASFIDQAAGNLTTAVVVGGVLVALVLAAFLLEWRSVVIGLIAVSLSLTTAMLVLYWTGTKINTLILAGLAIALAAVIDDDVADVERIVRRLRENRASAKPRPAPAVILGASLEVRGAALYATLIGVLVMVPVLFMGGLPGTFVRPLVVAYMLALLASMAVALTVTPALSLILLPGASLARREPSYLHRLQQTYEHGLARVMASSRLVFVATGVTALVGLAILPLLGRSLLPEFKEQDFLLRWNAEAGASLPQMSGLASEVTQKLRAIEGVREVGAYIGRAVTSDKVADVNTADIWVSLDPGADHDETMAAVSAVADDYPGLDPEPVSFSTMKLKDRLDAANDQIVVRVFGPDVTMLRSKAEEVRQALADVEGIVAPAVEAEVQEPEVEIEVNLGAAERYGLKPGDVRRAATTLLMGLEVGSLFEEQKVFEVVVVGTPETRTDLTSIQGLLVDTPTGGQVPLSEVANVRLTAAPAGYLRERASPRVDVTATVESGDLAAVMDEARARLEAIAFPLEYHAELLEDALDRQENLTQVVGYAVAAGIAILLVLHACFGSWSLAATTLIALAAGLIGGILAAVLTGAVLSLGSLAGLPAVLGLGTRNAILMVSHFRHLERVEGMPFGPRLLQRGAEDRLPPILATALATILAMLPLIVLGGSPGLEILHPMAVVVLGGVITSTLVSLLIVPALYAAFRAEPGRELEEEEGVRHAAV